MPQDGTHHPDEQRPSTDPTTETTSIGLPDLTGASTGDRPLDEENRQTVDALPIGSALLVAHAGPNQGARFLLDQDVTTAGRHPNCLLYTSDAATKRIV